MVGDGHIIPYHCEFLEIELDVEPDSGPYYCNESTGLDLMGNDFSPMEIKIKPVKGWKSMKGR